MKKEFDLDSYAWKKDVNYRKHPGKYRVGKGEQGVLLVEPYKSEILPFWRFKTPDIALESSKKIYQLFETYLEQDDFIGADMCRKFLQMGYTRARRYTNYKGGNKYDKVTGEQLERGTGDVQKAESAKIFYAQWKVAEAHPLYLERKKQWKLQYG